MNPTPTERYLAGRRDMIPGGDRAFVRGTGLDAITRHLALMPMVEADGICAEVRRVLRPGGTPTGFRSDCRNAGQPLCGPAGTRACTDRYERFTAKVTA